MVADRLFRPVHVGGPVEQACDSRFDARKRCRQSRLRRLAARICSKVMLSQKMMHQTVPQIDEGAQVGLDAGVVFRGKTTE